ncbi:hypothetical protein BDB00DRAFT_877260 [Zychaea mexicana]|uniref:uncharacterized protein n=1 Tax=Zychaea mexicana TaxID=64656 RepID=UPI0022FDC957|nr:uncharacterized protein BDB00DRAFT_877260 [Zychaea mexicana]KAI9488576.1 hypothetical protein BDB00DRAFT_877260 [Zychaea mexicana]
MKAYETGLQNVARDDPSYAQLNNGKDAARRQHEKRIDIVRQLPVEIVEEILMLLPKEFKSVCLQVSNAWCKKTSCCANAWKVSSDDDIDDDQMINTLQCIAAHVEDLTINTEENEVLDQYFLHMGKGHFSNIRSLHLTATAT